ncbi:hypothetical protein Rt10032_c17g5801 [Rhodotorula toruloides]|uniref:Uncharacterized protein n=1 Tax=Rhodotorula toruloides TaxID=5286 RepID=A0A511KQJ1_RHOTO|nr:hypothetical protein Rt10032_c17g5801 [Rhodotorula toruloides]
MPTSEKRREAVIGQVRGHIGRSWYEIHKLGDAASAALIFLEEMSGAEGDIPSIEDPEELAETEAYVEHMRTEAHKADKSGKMVKLWAEQEREMQEVYHLQVECLKAQENDLVDSIDDLIDEAREYADSSPPTNVAKTLMYKHEKDRKAAARRRHAAGRAKEEAEWDARYGPVPPLPNHPSGGPHALAKARRSGGGFRAGMRYFGWRY